MKFWNWLLSLFGSTPIGGSVTMDTSATGYTKPPDLDSHIRADMPLTTHFTLFALTTTEHTELQSANRDLTDQQVQKLTLVAELLETIQDIINMPIIVDDAFRCEKLNVLDGGVSNSQHALAEAADFIPKGIASLDKLKPIFQLIWDAAKAKKFSFGQMIIEASSAIPGNGWIHLSIGAPYRPLAQCGEVLSMKDGKYTWLDTIPQK
jgi:hypothetical protein